jgi:hypothetical protein
MEKALAAELPDQRFFIVHSPGSDAPSEPFYLVRFCPP